MDDNYSCEERRISMKLTVVVLQRSMDQVIQPILRVLVLNSGILYSIKVY